jgi:EAL domain-containing protein (putative c-di-GMP-specific phosphodiesterase class I)
MMREMKAMGVQISIDDFGTGYSSLARLRNFPIDTLKIDQSFLSDIKVQPTQPPNAVIVQAIIALAHGLKLKVIAEGVETEEQMAFLRSLQCNEVQGYLFSAPLPADEFEKLLKRYRK